MNPSVAKVGGLQSQGAKGKAVVCYCEHWGEYCSVPRQPAKVHNFFWINLTSFKNRQKPARAATKARV